ncbi:Laminin subunit alpha-2, partial [Desmophyllum pertusum]
IIFRAENGGGALVVEYVADNPLQLCKGQWHKIKAWKDGTVVKLQVDDGEILEGGGKGAQTVTGGLRSSLYLEDFQVEYTVEIYTSVLLDSLASVGPLGVQCEGVGERVR